MVAERRPPFRNLVGRRPARGAAAAAKQVADDVSSLLRAEIALAKAETTQAIKSKLIGAGFFIAAAVVGWLLVQALLVMIGIAVGQAARNPFLGALTVVVLLLVLIAVLGYLGYRKMQAQLSLSQTKANLEQDRALVTGAMESAKSTAQQEAALATNNLTEAALEVRDNAGSALAQVRRRGGRDVPAPTEDRRP